MKFKLNEPLKKHTSFRIGGPADYFCSPLNLTQLKEALQYARDNKLKIAILGAGSNVLALDKGFRGLIIQLSLGFGPIKLGRENVIVGAGVLLPKLIKFLSQKGYGNLEFLAGIPGSVGGAVAMNAGAWGHEIGKFVKLVKVLDLNGQEQTLRPEQLAFSYRFSSLLAGKYVAIEVALKIKKSTKKKVKALVADYLAKRKTSQPLGSPCCGSVFKNPPGEFAGKLIEQAGLKGLRVGDAQVSLKHANFILNLGDAKASDVLKLLTKIQKTVKTKLEPEVRVLQ